MNDKQILRTVTPKNKNQKLFFEAINEYPVVLSTGQAGSGKSFLAAFKALESLLSGEVDRIILVRPIIATEDIGFLPGDMKEKIDPYLMPLYDAFINLTSPAFFGDLMKQKVIEIAPLAFMRGRTFSNAFIILDEAQNSTKDHMKMFLTRFGENVKVVINGDLGQSDIKGLNGLQWAVETISESKKVARIQFTTGDIVRSSLVRDLVYYINKKEAIANANRGPKILQSAENIG